MQTSIEWFNEKISELDVEFHCELVTKEQYWIKRNQLLEQAKEMHKQEIINAHNSGFDKSSEGWNGEYGLMDMNNISEEIGSEQYYQETFKKD